MPAAARPSSTSGRIRRASATSLDPLRLVNRWRVCGFLLAAAAATWGFWLVTNRAFDLDPASVHVNDLVYTSADRIRQAINLAPNATPNVFRIDTGSMERALESLPAVANADVSVGLPNKLNVRVTERTPTFVLSTATMAYVVDVDGYILDELALAEATSVGLPIVNDLREQFAPAVAVGGRLDQVSLDASLRLASLTPADLDTAYDTLILTVDDTDGYVLSARPDGWRAVFGHYTPNLRPVSTIDRQVQCLRARLAAGESDLAVIYLAPLDDGCGTYLPRSSPTAAASPAPTSK